MYAVFERLVSNRRPDDDPVRVETCSILLSIIGSIPLFVNINGIPVMYAVF